ncbi:hypothetical protein [Microcoleus sp. Pol17_C1]|uniref:hypothetical protein n=1 Tax=unclassified Microcoleus TaxID=2642155 RepID=UPI002FD3E9B1
MAATYLGMMILLFGGLSKFWAMALAQGLRGSNLMGEGQGIDFFIVIYELFKVGIVYSRGVDGFADAASLSVASWQKSTSKISLLGELISKITDSSLQKFLRIAEYFVTLFAVLNCFDTLR